MDGKFSIQQFGKCHRMQNKQNADSAKYFIVAFERHIRNTIYNIFAIYMGLLLKYILLILGAACKYINNIINAFHYYHFHLLVATGTHTDVHARAHSHWHYFSFWLCCLMKVELNRAVAEIRLAHNLPLQIHLQPRWKKIIIWKIRTESNCKPQLSSYTHRPNTQTQIEYHQILCK